MADITESRPGVFALLLPPCTCQILPRVLMPGSESHVWLVGYRPTSAMRWVELPLPLDAGLPAETLRARLPRFDLQMPLPDFLERLPRMHAWSGMVAVQMSRPVPDTLDYGTLADLPHRDAILAQNGWMLSFYLPHDYEVAQVECADRAWLEQVAVRTAAG